MKTEKSIPVFVSVVTIILGCYDLLRGFMHTIVLDYSAKNIAALDLSTSPASDQLRLLGAFGISNFETGVVLILIGCYARPIALAMLGVIPLVYLIGHWGITANIASYAPTTAKWSGAPWLLVYLYISAATFIAGVIVMLKKKTSSLS